MINSGPSGSAEPREKTTIAIWKNCTADIYYCDDTPELNEPGYKVRIMDGVMVISYEGQDGWVNYTGRDRGGGHYALYAPEVAGHALLHRMPESEILNRTRRHPLTAVELRRHLSLP